ncbi:hypothetical protein F4809DRAFT_645417 [Biscogniauxia mediterranea]|nr:hypothetical protein F4809DRAFT_645417 [Biscogniauxia mediterranea]
MKQVDKLFQNAVADGRIHGTGLIAKDLTVANLSKLVTSIIVPQCAERGLEDLDEGIKKLLPEVAVFKVLTGFDDEGGKPIEREPKSPIFLSATRRRGGLRHRDEWVLSGTGTDTRELLGAARGNLSWAVMPDIHYWVWGFELRPWTDPISIDLGRKFEEALHTVLKE